MKILIGGSSGLIGGALAERLEASGIQVIRLVRRQTTNAKEIYWNPDRAEISAESLEGFDAIFHLGGKAVGLDRLTKKARQNIIDSRVRSTKLLVDSILKLNHPPKLFACASAVGFYGDRGNEKLTEQSSPGSGFLAELCHDWEAEVNRLAARPEIRGVSMRFGVVLSSRGGALKVMLLPFKLGLGGKLGNGTMYMSWISLEDTISAMIHILENQSLTGAVNIVGPDPATNIDFTKTLGKTLHRPTIFPLPGFLLRLIFGKGADAIMLSSQRVLPEKLLTSGFRFAHADLKSAFESALAD